MAGPEYQNQPLAYWLEKATSSISGAAPEKVAEVAELCAAHPERFPEGRPSIWHATAIVWNRLERCACYPCVKARGHL